MFRRDPKLLILTYHRVPAAPDPLFPEQVCAATFGKQMSLLARFFNVLPLASAVRALHDGDLPRRAVCITFDDGYRDNCDVALPLLNEHGFAATFFVASGYLGSGRMWNDTMIETIRIADDLDLSDLGMGRTITRTAEEKRNTIDAVLTRLKHLPTHDRDQLVGKLCSDFAADLPDDLMMSDGNVRQLAESGMEVGGHTVTHSILSRITLDEAKNEIQHNKLDLERLTGQRVSSFAYPNGRPREDYTDAHVELLRQCGFELAVTTAPGPVSQSSDIMQLSRIPVWSQSGWKFPLRLFVEAGK